MSASQPPGPQRPSSQRQRQAAPDKSISQIEKSVTHLLVATKQLLETLTQWSRKQAQEEEVSDVYVRLGYEFNLACRAFNSIGVDTSDLGPVPDLLRSILEDTLSQPASPQALDNYLPRIRDIIINLLHGLKRKQSRLRSRPSKDGSSSKLGSTRQGSTTSLDSTATGLTTMLQDVPSQASSMRSESRQDSLRALDEEQIYNGDTPISTDHRASISLHRQSMNRGRYVPQSDSGSSLSSTTAQSMPVLPPYNDPDLQQQEASQDNNYLMTTPAPPAKGQDALSALQKGGDLERRASRRFSAYQISKHLGASPNGVPMILPPAQNSPIPNRGQARDVRESMTAVRSRSTNQHGRTKSNNRLTELSGSPKRTGSRRSPERIDEEPEEPMRTLPSLQEVPRIPISDDSQIDDSPISKTPDEYHRPVELSDQSTPVLGATLNGPISPQLEESSYFPVPTPTDEKPVPPVHQKAVTPIEDEESTPRTIERKGRSNVTPPQSQLLDLESSPPQGKELTLFLQYKSKIKKFVLPEGYEDLTTARLQLAFIEKFAWNTHNNGVDLPDIYIQDPVSGVRHELEDLSDVKDRSVLVLNIEILDEVKRHFDDGIGGLKKIMESTRALIDGQGNVMQRVSDRQLETSKEVARMSAVPSRPVPSRTPTSNIATVSRVSTPNSSAHATEVQNLRRDIAVLRQTYSSLSSDFSAALTDIKTKAANVKNIAAEAAVPSYEGNAGRSHVNAGKKLLSSDSESLVNRVDDLSDLVEDLRKDVVQRGVRPLPRQLEDTSRDITETLKELAKMKEFLKREKPIWTKIWEQELNLVCTERDDLTQQEELMADLQGDLSDLAGVFKLVEEATKQQNLQNGDTPAPGVTLRNTSRNLAFDADIDPLKAKDGVLGEVRALQPNHENRLEAIERAEKLRQKELESRKGGEFQREVEKFVEEGKLKKTGGADEVERLRKIKDEKARKENYELLLQREIERARLKAEKEAAREAAAAAPVVDSHTNITNGDDVEADNEGPSSHDMSQEGEQAFEDAKEIEDERDSPPRLPELDRQEATKSGTFFDDD
jgi:hypothetical protein